MAYKSSRIYIVVGKTNKEAKTYLTKSSAIKYMRKKKGRIVIPSRM